MSPPTNPADMQAYILERLTGEAKAEANPDTEFELAEKKLATNLNERIEANIVAGIEVDLLPRSKGNSGEILGELQEDSAVALIGEDADAPSGLVHADSAAMAVLTSAVFGAEPEKSAGDKPRRLTVIDTRLFELFARECSGTIRTSEISQQSHPLISALNGEEFGKAGIRDFEAVAFRFNLRFGESTGIISLVLASALFVQKDDQVTAGNDNITKWHDSLKDGIMQMKIGVKAVIPLDQRTLADLNQLQVGDVLELPIDDPHKADLRVRDKTIFVGQFGRLGSKYTIRVSEPGKNRSNLVDHIMATM